MATVTVVEIEQSGPAIRAALVEHTPGNEQARGTRAKAGDVTGLSALDGYGNWITL